MHQHLPLPSLLDCSSLHRATTIMQHDRWASRCATTSWRRRIRRTSLHAHASFWAAACLQMARFLPAWRRAAACSRQTRRGRPCRSKCVTLISSAVRMRELCRWWCRAPQVVSTACALTAVPAIRLGVYPDVQDTMEPAPPQQPGLLDRLPWIVTLLLWMAVGVAASLAALPVSVWILQNVYLSGKH